MDIFGDIQSSCPKCGTFLRREFPFSTTEVGGTASLPSGTSSVLGSYDAGLSNLSNQGIHLNCPNPNCDFTAFKLFDAFDYPKGEGE